ncbi:MAG TPA: hypothetical protein PLJ78_01105 [Anaerolineae bacterium]|nr:hypothetical protein [Anaerolineae bacterium]HQK12521.1 hypothetical protein [Anaerolineae bacterium]
MHLLYLDDSGSVLNRDEQYFVLGGVCVPETSVRWLSHKLDEIACEIDPQTPTQVEFHAATILADHIAYAVFRRYNANDLTYFNCIEGRFYQDGGVMHGLAHRQTYNDRCTCPACLTRRNAR